ncbi:unnamed protein product, partial [Scytosiphon promiscuus]
MTRPGRGEGGSNVGPGNKNNTCVAPSWCAFIAFGCSVHMILFNRGEEKHLSAEDLRRGIRMEYHCAPPGCVRAFERVEVSCLVTIYIAQAFFCTLANHALLCTGAYMLPVSIFVHSLAPASRGSQNATEGLSSTHQRKPRHAACLVVSTADRLSGCGISSLRWETVNACRRRQDAYAGAEGVMAEVNKALFDVRDCPWRQPEVERDGCGSSCGAHPNHALSGL